MFELWSNGVEDRRTRAIPPAMAAPRRPPETALLKAPDSGAPVGTEGAVPLVLRNKVSHDPFYSHRPTAASSSGTSLETSSTYPLVAFWAAAVAARAAMATATKLNCILTVVWWLRGMEIRGCTGVGLR